VLLVLAKLSERSLAEGKPRPQPPARAQARGEAA
jgi:hypothetical protein